METKFKIDFPRLVDKLLPISLRSNIFKTLLLSAFSVFDTTIWEYFRAARKDDYFNLKHNGQVCYLRAALNEKFKSSAGLYFDIADPMDIADWEFALTEAANDGHIFASKEPVPEDGLFATSETVANELNTFIIYVPADLYNSQLASIRRFVDKYRLVTRRPQYELKNS